MLIKLLLLIIKNCLKPYLLTMPLPYDKIFLQHHVSWPMIKYLYKKVQKDFEMNQQNISVKASWDRFAAAHPKFPLFLRAVSDGNVMQETIASTINSRRTTKI